MKILVSWSSGKDSAYALAAWPASQNAAMTASPSRRRAMVGILTRACS